MVFWKSLYVVSYTNVEINSLPNTVSERLPSFKSLKMFRNEEPPSKTSRHVGDYVEHVEVVRTTTPCTNFFPSR